jgi:hypothetical protein
VKLHSTFALQDVKDVKLQGFLMQFGVQFDVKSEPEPPPEW